MEIDFSRVIDTLPGLVWTALPDGRADFVNSRWIEYTGLASEDASGEGWQATIHPDDQAHLVGRWLAITQTREAGELEARMRRHDGEYRWFLFRFCPLTDDAGEIVRWCGVNTDIEDRKQAEAALRAHEQRAQMERRWAESLLAGEKRLLQMVAEGAALTDILETLCALVEETAIGSLCSVLTIDPDGLRFRHGAGPSLPAAYNAMLDGLIMDRHYGPCGMASNLKTQVIAADVANDPRWRTSPWPALVVSHGLRSCWSTPIFSRNDKVIGVFALYQNQPGDPTAVELDLISQFAHLAGIAIERTQSDAALKRSEVRKAAVLGSALDCIITIDHEGRIIEFNPAAEQTFGYRLEEVIGRPLAETIIPPSLRDQHRKGLARYLDTGEARVIGRHIELTAMRADGSEFPVELAITRNPSDEPPSFTGFLRDISERHTAEEALGKVRSELANMARVTSLGALTASIAHEVNQPLSGIITNASTCLKMLAADPPNVEGAQETARRTVRDGNRAADVIKRLRALFTNKNANDEPVDLSEAAREVIALSAADLQRTRASLRSELADDLPPVMGDRVQLQQVIVNLLLNAADAMSGVEDRPRHLVVRTEREDADQVRLSITDAGVGFDPDRTEELFQAFYTTKREGMGIGLFVCRSIVENHGGRLWAEGNDGPGATFSFSLPRHSEHAAVGGIPVTGQSAAASPGPAMVRQ